MLGWAWVHTYLYLVRTHIPGSLNGLHMQAEKSELWPRTC